MSLSPPASSGNSRFLPTSRPPAAGSGARSLFPAGLGAGALSALLFLAASCSGGEPFDPAAYRAGEEAWRAEQEADLRSDGSWLTVADLHFLTAGEHTVGSGEDADLRLPERFPGTAVTVSWSKDGVATARVAEGVSATVAGEPFTEGELEVGEESAVHLDDRVRFWLHTSGERRALRLRDLDHPVRTNFTGRRWFEVDPAYRVEAVFERYAEPRNVEAINIRGDIERYVSHGDAVFERDGAEIRMQAFTRSSGRLFFVMSDATSGAETYRAARFLEVPPPEGDRVILDFNRAENPPCGFSQFTTCPTPPPSNRLAVRIEAGELRYEPPPASSTD